jgi:hypothetical protein
MPDEIHHIEIIGTGMRTLGISTVSDVSRLQQRRMNWRRRYQRQSC